MNSKQVGVLLRLRRESKMSNNIQLINQDSGEYEYYSPPEIVEAARKVMASISMDPASSAIANETIQANTFLSKFGLSYEWIGNIWLNHPFSRKNNPIWINKLISEYDSGNIYQACCITYAATSEIWFQPLLQFPQCFLSPRTNYYLPDGTKKKGVTKGSVVTYLGPNQDLFANVFSQFGMVK